MNELEQRWRDLGEFIREQRHLGEMSLRKLSERAGISNPYLSQIERGLRRPSAEILQQIAKALQISAETLYVRAGILDADTEAPRAVDVIRHDPDLTEDQKKTLITVYESFRTANAAALDGILGALGTTGAGLDGGDRTDGERTVTDEPADPEPSPGAEGSPRPRAKAARTKAAAKRATGSGTKKAATLPD